MGLGSTIRNKSVNVVASTFDFARTIAGSKGLARAKAVSSEIARGAKLRGGWAYGQYAAGAVAGGATGYTLSDNRSQVSGTLKGAGLGVLGVGAGKLGYSAYKSPGVRAGIADGRSAMRGAYSNGRSRVVRRAANIMESARSESQQMDYIRGFYGGEGY